LLACFLGLGIRKGAEKKEKEGEGEKVDAWQTQERGSSSHD
jgi:hypothetical protein